MIIIYLLSFLLSCLIIFYIVKYAIKSGIRASHKEIENNSKNQLTQKRIELQRKYDQGEITFEVYSKEWDIT